MVGCFFVESSRRYTPLLPTGVLFVEISRDRLGLLCIFVVGLKSLPEAAKERLVDWANALLFQVVLGLF